MSKTIALTQGQVVLVDDDDYEQLSKHKWYAVKRHSGFYAERKSKIDKRGRQRHIRMSCVILNAQPGQLADHINGDTLDNRKANLRLCTHSENVRNQKVRAGGSSRYKGVGWYKANRKWRARIKYDSRYRHLGYFVDEEDAARAYNKAATRLFGKFARLNSIPSSKKSP